MKRTSCLFASVLSLAAASVTQGQTAPTSKTTLTTDLGVVSSSGNTRLSTINVGNKLTHSVRKWVFTQLSTYVYGETEGLASANQLRASVRSDYAFATRLSVFTAASYERNRFAGFTRRTDELLGVSWKAMGLARDTLAMDAGGVLTQSRFVDSTEKNYPAGRIATAYKHAFSAASYFQQLAEYLPNLKSSGEYRLNTESALIAPISSHAAIKLSYVIRYDTAPALGFGTTDRILTAGIQVSF
ncbi:MAG: DUF481 domain-containing protein [Gemmatimonadaceae bacterium]